MKKRDYQKAIDSFFLCPSYIRIDNHSGGVAVGVAQAEFRITAFNFDEIQ